MVVRQQILKTRTFTRTDLLNQDFKTNRRNKLVLLTIQPSRNVNNNLLLTPDAQHGKISSEVPIVVFKRGKSLKDLLVREKVPVEKEADGKSCGCQEKHCEGCTFS